MVRSKLSGGGRQQLTKRKFMDAVKQKVMEAGVRMEGAGLDK